jgi:hypothetical protein
MPGNRLLKDQPACDGTCDKNAFIMLAWPAEVSKLNSPPDTASCYFQDILPRILNVPIFSLLLSDGE